MRPRAARNGDNGDDTGSSFFVSSFRGRGRFAIVRDRFTMRKAAIQAPPVSVATYREDPLYPRVTRAVDAILQHGQVSHSADLLIDFFPAVSS